MRPSIRLASLMKAHVIYVWTHDSIAVGEDGATHQPVEQLAGLRAMPNMMVLRPGDATYSRYLDAVPADVEAVDVDGAAAAAPAAPEGGR